ncbi:hypothetical protein LV85_02552 [Algoriphagus chordae]|uniref:Uncharacterized protein n=1 Tax=Algoriphagus chordae TaxID=237019 RepID=A0A2W7R9T8_9BACT|nr:hypothetical protein LV85_02552 [Algoriphagus chordae]
MSLMERWNHNKIQQLGRALRIGLALVALPLFANAQKVAS